MAGTHEVEAADERHVPRSSSVRAEDRRALASGVGGVAHVGHGLGQERVRRQAAGRRSHSSVGRRRHAIAAPPHRCHHHHRRRRRCIVPAAAAAAAAAQNSGRVRLWRGRGEGPTKAVRPAPRRSPRRVNPRARLVMHIFTHSGAVPAAPPCYSPPAPPPPLLRRRHRHSALCGGGA